MTRLWNFLRVSTLKTGHHLPGGVITGLCAAGISPFRQALPHLGASECEVVVVPTTNWTVVNEYLRFISRSQISVLTIMVPDARALSQIPLRESCEFTSKVLLPVHGLDPCSHGTLYPSLFSLTQVDLNITYHSTRRHAHSLIEELLAERQQSFYSSQSQ